MKKLSRMISPQRAKTNAKRAQNTAYNQAQIAAQSGQAPQNMGQFDRRQRTNLKQMAQGNYRPPASRMPAPQMAPPMQAPQGQGGGQVGIGNFMQNQMQQQMPTPPEGQGWEQAAGGGYHNPTMFAQQQQKQLGMRNPYGASQGGYSAQVMPQQGQMQQPAVQGKQWIRG